MTEVTEDDLLLANTTYGATLRIHFTIATNEHFRVKPAGYNAVVAEIEGVTYGMIDTRFVPNGSGDAAIEYYVDAAETVDAYLSSFVDYL